MEKKSRCRKRQLEKNEFWIGNKQAGRPKKAAESTARQRERPGVNRRREKEAFEGGGLYRGPDEQR